MLSYPIEICDMLSDLVNIRATNATVSQRTLLYVNKRGSMKKKILLTIETNKYVNIRALS